MGGAPTWVYILLVVLVALGIRRLRTRDVPVVVAMIPVVAFLAWSVVGGIAFARFAGPGMALLAWVGGAAIGVASTYLVAEPRGQRLPGNRVRQPGSWLPLILYMAVFVIRFACGAWAAMAPSQATIATATGIAVGAAMTARLIVAVLRWQPVEGAGLTA